MALFKNFAKPSAPQIIPRKQFLLAFRRRLQNFLSFLLHKERIAALLVREGGVELALWETKFDTAKGSEKKELAFYHRVSLPPNTVQEGKLLRPENLKQALNELKKQAAKFSLRSVIVSLPSSLAQFIVLTFPLRLERKQVTEAVRLAAESSFPLPPEKLYYDWVFSESGDAGKQEVVVGIARRQDIDSYLGTITQNGFSPVAVETHAMSAARLFPLAIQARLLLFFEPSEIATFVYHRGLPHIQHHVPQSVIDSDKTEPEKEIYLLLQHLVHAARSGEEGIIVEDLLIIPDVVQNRLAPALAQNNLPPLAKEENSFQLPEKIALEDSWKAVALGAALRGTIARKLDTLISFMAVGTERAYERARLLSFIDFLQKFSMIAGAFFVGVFLLALIFINTLGKNIEEAFSQSPSLSPEFTALRDKAVGFNEKVKAIHFLNEKNPRWERFFQEIDKITNAGVRIKYLQFSSAGEIRIEGVAQSRDALLQLKATLENSPVFSFTPLPLPLLLEKDNIAFSLILGLKNAAILFP